ncbi:MAG: LysR family transcriptional regulator [Treponema sp.]|nr:LysR family transcriptional regulator [Treponema sp.]
MDLEMLKTRASVIQKIRSFFIDRGYLELDTPLLSDNLIPESCLEVFQTEKLYPKGSRKQKETLWLIPSPEIWMKKIIARHRVNVFQICKCFRNGEQSGRLHNSEFTMLEYYTMNADYTDSLVLTEELFKAVNNGCSLTPFDRITVARAFMEYAGFDLFKTSDKGAMAMADKARELGLDPEPSMTVSMLYDLIFIHCVERNLKKEKPVALIDYPAFVPCLAKNKGQTVERWELYHNGVELANCFSEETDPQKVKEFFINEEKEKEKAAIVKHKVNRDYWKIFEKEKNFPRCSGVAMGLDRFIMTLTGKSSVDSVLMTAD